jgi:hypothetical protein
MRIFFRNKQAKVLGQFNDYLLLPCNILYAPIPKAANTTIKHLFLNVCNKISDTELAHIKQNPQSIHGIMKRHYGIEKEEFYRLGMSNKCFCFSVLRDPIQRFKSFYLDKILNNGWPREMYGHIYEAYGILANQAFKDVVDIACRIPDRLADIHFRSQYDILGGAYSLQCPYRLYDVSEVHKLLNDLAVHGLSLNPSIKINNATPSHLTKSIDHDISLYSKLVKRYSFDYSLIATLRD